MGETYMINKDTQPEEAEPKTSQRKKGEGKTEQEVEAS